ncbi:hypothetical protein FSP39_025020 [Pinctada imbricata]|uniref:Uncharacterized protein n=1 Tax=Pinctada imbricata TaxID=66713 RepID=A0AA89BQA7_PINIB|nr:hypothetical protein FSP39_025020 [Pinctada imbricata]
MTLGDRGLDLPADMEHVEKVMLWQVSMSAEQWQQFILSLLNIQHTFDVFLHETNIDDESKTKVRESPDFNITLDNMLDKYGGKIMEIRASPWRRDDELKSTESASTYSRQNISIHDKK